MSELAVTLPIPPSVNHCYRRRGNGPGMYLTEEAKAWKEYAAFVVSQAAAALRDDGVHLDGGPFMLMAWLYWPNRRKHDIDNIFKLLQDAIADGLRVDDSSVVEIHAYKLYDKANPRCEVRVTSVKEARD